ncbi:hypothetical protein ACFV9C_35510 [Kribbella sp. NPDC059898]|uniref:hypothetical protein n=1 Tax=Kribbella sp. NPDC059898 TaxID=3346995 RepID=UPI00365F55AB
MREAEGFVSLAEAVGQGRLSAADFKVLCRPLFRFSRCHFLSREEYVAARDLFFVSDDYWEREGDPPAGLLTADEVRVQAAEIAARLRSDMDDTERRIREHEARTEEPDDITA